MRSRKAYKTFFTELCRRILGLRITLAAFQSASLRIAINLKRFFMQDWAGPCRNSVNVVFVRRTVTRWSLLASRPCADLVIYIAIAGRPEPELQAQTQPSWALVMPLRPGPRRRRAACRRLSLNPLSTHCSPALPLSWPLRYRAPRLPAFSVSSLRSLILHEQRYLQCCHGQCDGMLEAEPLSRYLFAASYQKSIPSRRRAMVTEIWCVPKNSKVLFSVRKLKNGKFR